MAIGRTISGSLPISATICCAKPNQVVALWLVRWMMPLRRSRPTLRSIGARSAVNVGWPIWSSTNESTSRSAARRMIVFTMLLP